jgi:hypothetical protein
VLTRRSASHPGPPPWLPVGTGVDFADGWQAAPGFVQHRLRGDAEAQLLLVGHVLETYAAAWGFAKGLGGLSHTIARHQFGVEAAGQVRAVAELCRAAPPPDPPVRLTGRPAGCARDLAGGHRDAATFLDHVIRRDAPGQHLVLRRRLGTGAGSWGLLLGLADVGIAFAEARFGGGEGWARALIERVHGAHR